MLTIIGIGVMLFADANLDGVVTELERGFARSFWIGLAGQLLALPGLLIVVVGLAITVLGAAAHPVRDRRVRHRGRRTGHARIPRRRASPRRRLRVGRRHHVAARRSSSRAVPRSARVSRPLDRDRAVLPHAGGRHRPARARRRDHMGGRHHRTWRDHLVARGNASRHGARRPSSRATSWPGRLRLRSLASPRRRAGRCRRPLPEEPRSDQDSARRMTLSPRERCSALAALSFRTAISIAPPDPTTASASPISTSA